MKKLLHEFTKGLFSENPIFFIVLGLCPALAVSTSVSNAIGMGLAATFVLVCSNSIISLMRNFIPDKIRIPSYIVVIASFVVIVEMVMKAYAPELGKSLGVYVPLIVVNCIILGRAEAFASKNPFLTSFLDGLGMGVGFTLALLIISTIREVLGHGTFAGRVLVPSFEPALIFGLAPGALLIMGLLMGGIKWIRSLRSP